jgi:hypothetical protein
VGYRVGETLPVAGGNDCDNTNCKIRVKVGLLDDYNGLLKELVAEEAVHTSKLQGTKVCRNIPFIESFQSLSFHSLPLNDHYHFGLAYSSVISFHYYSHND